MMMSIVIILIIIHSHRGRNYAEGEKGINKMIDNESGSRTHNETVDEEGPLLLLIFPRTRYNQPYIPILLPLAEPSTYDLSLLEIISTSNSNSNNNFNYATTPTILFHSNLERNVSYWIGYCHIRSVSYQNCIAVPWN
jgi:hypothetical protein